MITSVPFFRPSIGEAEIEAVTQTMRSGWLTSGPISKQFETEFANCLVSDSAAAAPHAIAVNSATAALHLGLEALGVGPGDEVIVPTLTFTATAEVVRYLGASPVFVDIDPSTLCMDLGAVKDAVTPFTKVILPVHFGGRPCDLTQLRQIADRHGLFILDDAAHAFPAYHKGCKIGASLADATAFSFYANKTMTTGEGGMLVTRHDSIAERARIMRLHGIDRDVFNRFTDNKASWLYDVVAPGYKYNLTDSAAALGRVQLSRVDEFHDRRRRLAEKYFGELSCLPVILPPAAADGDVHSWHLFVIQVTSEAARSRDELAHFMQSQSIGISVHYRPLHQMTYWANVARGHFPEADTYFDRCLSLPLFMDMADEEFDYIVSSLKVGVSG